jgi:hypothetical protein
MVQLNQKLNPTQARQGSPRRSSFRVLIGSLILSLVAAVALYTAFWTSAPIEERGVQQGPAP